tara:strand:+ start:317 stop:919 length:603 start_codon:yes stop_codon:yes gene_type:complete
MAYGISIPGRSVASNYAASFRPVTAVPGFSQVKSDLAANYLMQVPMLKQQLEMEMANAALQEAGSIKRTQMNVEGTLDLQKMKNKQALLKNLLAESGGGQEVSALDELYGVNYTNALLQDLRDRRMNTTGLGNLGANTAAVNNTLEELSTGRSNVSGSISADQGQPATLFSGDDLKSGVDKYVDQQLDSVIQQQTVTPVK